MYLLLSPFIYQSDKLHLPQTVSLTTSRLTFIAKFGEPASIATKSVAHVAEMPLHVTDAILHEPRLIVTATFSSCTVAGSIRIRNWKTNSSAIADKLRDASARVAFTKLRIPYVFVFRRLYLICLRTFSSKQTSEEPVSYVSLAPGSDLMVPSVTSTARLFSVDLVAETGNAHVAVAVTCLLRGGAVGVR